MRTVCIQMAFNWHLGILKRTPVEVWRYKTISTSYLLSIKSSHHNIKGLLVAKEKKWLSLPFLIGPGRPQLFYGIKWNSSTYVITRLAKIVSLLMSLTYGNHMHIYVLSGNMSLTQFKDKFDLCKDGRWPLGPGKPLTYIFGSCYLNRILCKTDFNWTYQSRTFNEVYYIIFQASNIKMWILLNKNFLNINY